MHPAYGQALYWDTNGTTPGSGGPSPSGTWGTGNLNWNTDPTGGSGGSFTDTTTISTPVTFSAGTDATGNYTVTLSGNQSAAAVAITYGTVALTGSNLTLATGGNITNTSGSLTTFSNEIYQATGGNFSVLGNSSVSFQTITAPGAFGVTIGTLGDGSTRTVTLGGSSDNSFMTLVVNSGTVDLAKASSGSIHATDGMVLNGGTVQMDGTPASGTLDQQFYFGGTETINGGTLDLNGRNEYFATIAGAGGTITNTNASTLATFSVGGGTYTGNISDGAGQVGVSLVGTGTANLNNNNVFSGGIRTISTGTLNMTGNNSLGAGNIAVSAGNLLLTGNNSGSGAITVAGGNLTLGTNVNTTGVNSFTGNIAIKAGNLTFYNPGNFGTGNLTIGDSGNTGLAATLIFNNSNIPTGNITTPIFVVGNGTNTIVVANRAPNFSGNITLSANLNLLSQQPNGGYANPSFTGAITGSGNITLQSLLAPNGGSNTNNTITLSNSVNNGGTITNSGNNTATVTISGNIGSNVTGVIENSATSPLTLSGSNSFSGGLTIKAGTVNFNNANALGNATITLGDSGNTGLAATLALANSYTPTNAITSTGTGTNTIIVTNNNPTFSGPITLSNNLTLISNNSGGSNLVASGNVTGNGNLFLQVLNTNAGSKVTLSGASINNTGLIINNGGNGTGNGTINGNIGANVTGVIESSNLSPLNISGTSTFGSGLTIKAGIVNDNTNTTNGLGTGNVTLGDSANTGLDATLNLGANTITVANPLLSVGNGTNTIFSNNDTQILTGPVSLSNNLTLSASGTTNGGHYALLYFTGNVTGSANLTLQLLGNHNNVTLNLGNSTVTNSINETGAIVANGTGNGTINIYGNIGGNVSSLTEDLPNPNASLKLIGAATYAGPTTVNSGTLQVGTGSGTAGSLNGTAGTPLTFGGTGTVNIDEAASSTQGMGNLTLSDGEATIKSTFVGTSATLTFANVNARATGAVANFVESGGSSSTNQIVLTNFQGSTTPTGALLDPGLFFNGSSYAAYNAPTGYVRAYNYTTDSNGNSTSGGPTLGSVSGENVQMTGNVAAQTTIAINTLKIANNANLTFADASETLTTSGILLSGNTAGGATISGGAGVEAPNNGELVIRTDAVNDALTINSPVVGNGTDALTKSGVGTLTLGGSNSYTGLTSVDAGTLALSTSLNNNIGNSTAIAIAPNATLNVSAVTGTGGFALASGQVLGGRGTVTGNLTVASGSKISAGFSSAMGIATGPSNINGMLTTGNETWSAGGTYSWKITSAGGIGPGNTTTNNGGNPGIDWDDISMSALTVPSSGNFTIAPVGSISVAAGASGGYYNWVIAQTSSGNFTTPGTTNLLAGGSAAFALNTSGLTINGVSSPSSSLFTLELINVSGSNDDLVLGYNSAPEPGTALLLLAGAAPLVMGRRRRAKNVPSMSVLAKSEI
jgi:autotransporter-associated beta strand protein